MTRASDREDDETLREERTSTMVEPAPDPSIDAQSGPPGAQAPEVEGNEMPVSVALASKSSTALILGPEPSRQRHTADREMERLMGGEPSEPEQLGEPEPLALTHDEVVAEDTGNFERELVPLLPPERTPSRAWVGWGLSGLFVTLIVGSIALVEPTSFQLSSTPRARAIGLAASARGADVLDNSTSWGERPEGIAGSDDGDMIHGRDSDRRTPPIGTAPEAELAFRKVPTVTSDRPPIGGVGGSGIHVDRINVGSEWHNSNCKGERVRFQLSSLDRISVCFRVVHHRLDESVTVVWQQDGHTRRRATIPIESDRHAFRTGAHLILREGYTGTWTVRVLSDDGVELASQAFNVID